MRCLSVIPFPILLLGLRPLAAQGPANITTKCEGVPETCLVELRMDSVGPFEEFYAFNVYKIPTDPIGANVSHGDLITLMLASFSRSCQYRQDSSVQFYLDDKPFSLQAETRYIPCTTNGDGVKESIAIILPLKEFYQMLAARTLVARVGDHQFPFSSVQLSQLRELAEHIRALTNPRVTKDR